MSSAASPPDNLVDLLKMRAQVAPDRLAFRFLLDGENKVLEWTYRELDQTARRVAAALLQLPTRPRQALLLYPPSLDYVAAFFGCLYAGVTAVPAYPPDPSRLSRTLPRLQAIIRDSRSDVLMMTDAVAKMVAMMGTQAPEIAGCQHLATDLLHDPHESIESALPVSSDTLAFLQYTSGSTSLPRGVRLSHGNLMHNMELVRQGFRLNESSSGVIWLPPYHDMGLIGGILQGVYSGFPITLLSPLAFLSRPMRWLEAVDRYRATVSGGPNFAFELCIRKSTPAQRAQLDLSNWKVAFCGAEPIRPSMLSDFCAAFAPAGFERRFFYPCYGLAEGTLIVSGGHANQEPRVDTISKSQLALRQRVASGAGEPDAVVELVGCGGALGDQELVIVDPKACNRLADGQVGEIWVRGPSISEGYFQPPEPAGEGPFGAKLHGEPSGPSFLRTGDLGYLSGGELFVTGRCKDLLIIRGRNVYPQDIEQSLEDKSQDIRPGCLAVFSVGECEDQVVAVCELRRGAVDDTGLLIRELAAAVSGEHQVDLYDLVLLPSGAVPKTSSGKVQRSMAKVEYLEQCHEPIASLQAMKKGPDMKTENAPVALHLQLQSLAVLAECVSLTLEVETSRMRIDQPISDFGFDSLRLVELQSAIAKRTGAHLPLETLFSAPTLVQLSAMVDAAGTSSTLFRASARASEYALQGLASANQSALWFLDRTDRDQGTSHVSRALALSPSTRDTDIIAALEALMQRHRSLRTTFVESEGRLLRRVSTVAMSQRCVSTTEADGSELAKQMAQEAARPFSLEEGPLFRIVLYRGPNRLAMQWTFHHIVIDFVSIANLVREFAALLTKEALDETPLQIDDFLSWQDAFLVERREAQRSYWLALLAKAPPFIELPYDSTPTPNNASMGASVSLTLNSELVERIHRLAQFHKMTTSTILLAAYAVTLARLCGQEDLVIGMPTLGRRLPEHASVVGFCSGMVPIRLLVNSDRSCQNFLRETAKRIAEALENQELSLSEIVAAQAPPRDPARQALFQVSFSPFSGKSDADQAMGKLAAGMAGASLRLGSFEAQSLEVPFSPAQFDLSLLVAEETSAITCVFEYASERLRSLTVEGFARGFETMLGAMAKAGRDTTLGSLEWGTSVVHPQSSPVSLVHSVHQLFVDKALACPDLQAVSYDATAWSYKQLDRRSNHIANRLLELGATTETRIALCLPQSADLVASMMGCLKAGCAFVPIDASHPLARRGQIAEAASVSLWIQDEEVADSPNHIRSHELQGEASAHEGPREVHPDSLAYVLFTSGSTGTPKGVMISHRSLLNRLRWGQEHQPIADGDAVLQFTSPSFDVSIWEVFSALGFGGHLIIPTQGQRRSLSAFAALATKHHIRMAGFVPSFLQLLSEEQGLACLRSLRYLFSGGEELTLALARRLRDDLPATEVYNFYGPTETTIDATWFRLPKDEDLHHIPIGQAVAWSSLHVLDSNLRSVPDGCVGHLYVGGVALARGYSGAPAQTAERFLPDPFSHEPGARMYNTGDLVRRMPNGEHLFEGRSDRQVKIRGQRIELGEVEHALRCHEAVADAAVVITPWISPLTKESILAEIESLTESAALAYLASELYE